MYYFGVSILWLLHWFPLPILAWFGNRCGDLLWHLARERRHVALTNLSRCFPDRSEAERTSMARQHFRAYSRAFLEHGILWWGSRQRVERLVRFVDIENWLAVRNQPVIWLAPHFIGLDMGGIRITTEYNGASIYANQKNPRWNRLLRQGRERFGRARLFSRQDGIRPVIRALRSGWPLYYLPDMDWGPKESIFVPFFGIATATSPALSRLAELAQARIVPVITRQLPDGQGYQTRFYPAWEDFPSGDIEADARRMNAFIESCILEMPEQYLWTHKRFKTRPSGEPKWY